MTNDVLYTVGTVVITVTYTLMSLAIRFQIQNHSSFIGYFTFKIVNVAWVPVHCHRNTKGFKKFLEIVIKI